MKRTSFLVTIVALVLVSLAAIVQADDSSAIVRAQGNPYHLNFISASSKRGDLRLKIATRGLDAAFTEWLKSEHPAEYRGAVAHALTSGNKTYAAFRSASSYCCAKDGGCCKANCGQCCAKGNCTMGCCNMDVCKKMRHSCCR